MIITNQGLRGISAEAAGFAHRQSGAAALLNALGGAMGTVGVMGAIGLDLVKP